MQGYFKRDHAFFREYAAESRTADGFEAWLKKWVVDVADHGEYMKRIDADSLRVKGRTLSAPANFADE